MAINERIITGRKFRRLIDKEAKLWQRFSWWTKASDVEFDDGKTAEQKLGNINGITSDMNMDRDDIASSISAVHNVIEEMHYRINHFKIYKDEDGNIYIIDENEGADAVPKKLGDSDPEDFGIGIKEYIFTEDTSHVYVFTKNQIGDEVVNKIIMSVTLPNGKKINMKPTSKLVEDQESGISIKRINWSYISPGGSMYYTCLFLIENIVSGSILKCSDMTVFK